MADPYAIPGWLSDAARNAGLLGRWAARKAIRDRQKRVQKYGAHCGACSGTGRWDGR